MAPKETTLLLILDGWGVAPDTATSATNAILAAHTPYWDNLLEIFPWTTLASSGNAVGLPEGIMGNSEVGHLNIGAGRIVWQEITRIDKAIEDDGLMSRKPFVDAIVAARDSGANLHLMGLVSDGGVHSMDRHYFALLRLAHNRLNMPPERVFFHCYLDGRDTPPRSGLEYVRVLEEAMQKESLGRIATVSGRYWAMDRDKRWDRVQKAYDALVYRKSDVPMASSGVEAVSAGYGRDENDEFVKPTVITANGQPIGKIESNDQIIFFNFRPDRARQLSHAFVDSEFTCFPRKEDLKVGLTTMAQYESNLKATVAFPPQDISLTLGEVISNAGMTQLRIAETEKYAHVTYFFSGGREAEFPGEERMLIPSPKVATYDLQPEMSVPEVSARLEQQIRSGKWDLIVCNFANGDMVGHTGIMEAAIKAAEAVDAAVKRVVDAILKTNGTALITADHGNAEEMWNPEEGCVSTQHSLNKTPLVIVSRNCPKADLRKDGCLADIAPTVLQLMHIAQPEKMTGKSLI